MTLTLRVVSLNDLPLTQPIAAQFDAQGGTIGRADHNTMALPDPERHISRQQAEIRPGVSGYVIRNTGSANPITVRGQSLAQDQSLPLAHGDEVRIGGYVLEVIDDVIAMSADAGATVVKRGLAPGLSAAARVEPPSGTAPVAGPLVDGLDTNPLASRPTPPSPTPAASAAERLPDDFDPFAPPPAHTPPLPPPSASVGNGAFADLVPSENDRSIDELYGLSLSVGDPLAGFMAGASAAPSGPTADTPAVADHTPALQSSFQPPALPPRAPTEPAVEVPQAMPGSAVANAGAPAHNVAMPATVGTGDIAGLWQAFCEGAGVRLEPPQKLDADLMRMVGELLRAAVEGCLQLMAVRAATKHELRAQVTVIQSRNNNPLKFSPDAQSALEQLLQPPVRGFLPGPAAMADAMQDLVGHAIGSMAGTRAALEGVLARFSPQALENKLAARSVLDSVLPSNRKAKLWTLYLQHFDAIHDEAQEDFHTLFGKAFLAAYDEQLQRLQDGKSAP